MLYEQLCYFTARCVLIDAVGTELSFMMQHRLRDELEKAGKDPNSLSVTLFNRGTVLMQEHGT